MEGQRTGDEAGGRPARRGLAREMRRALVVVGVCGSSVGGVVGMVALATRLVGR